MIFVLRFGETEMRSHLHVVKEKRMRQKSAKIWLKTLEVTERGTSNNTDIKLALKIIKLHQVELLESF